MMGLDDKQRPARAGFFERLLAIAFIGFSLYGVWVVVAKIFS